MEQEIERFTICLPEPMNAGAVFTMTVNHLGYYEVNVPKGSSLKILRKESLLYKFIRKIKWFFSGKDEIIFLADYLYKKGFVVMTKEQYASIHICNLSESKGEWQ